MPYRVDLTGLRYFRIDLFTHSFGLPSRQCRPSSRAADLSFTARSPSDARQPSPGPSADAHQAGAGQRPERPIPISRVRMRDRILRWWVAGRGARRPDAPAHLLESRRLLMCPVKNWPTSPKVGRHPMPYGFAGFKSVAVPTFFHPFQPEHPASFLAGHRRPGDLADVHRQTATCGGAGACGASAGAFVGAATVVQMHHRHRRRIDQRITARRFIRSRRFWSFVPDNLQPVRLTSLHPARGADRRPE